MSLDLDKADWRRVAFGEVVKNINVTVKDAEAAGIDRVIAMDHLDSGELQIRRWGGLHAGTTFTRRVTAGQTVFGKRRAYQRKAAYAEFDAITSGDILVFDADKSQLLAEFLPFVVQSDGFYSHALGTSAGSLSPRTNWRDLANYEFDLPPVTEQARLTDLLWALEREARAVTSLIGSFAGARAKTVDAFLGAHSARSRPIGEIVESLRDGPFGSKIKTEHYGESGVRVLRLQDVQKGTIVDTDICFLKANHVQEALGAYRVQVGDIVIAGLGDDSHPVGRAALADVANGAVHKADVFRARVRRELVRPAYLVEVLNADYSRSLVRARSQGTTRLRVNTTNLKRVSLPFPSIAEQDDLISALSCLDLAEGHVRRRAGAVATARRTMSHQVFGGAHDVF